MTTTTTFKGVDPNSRNSSRVLRPPGGGSNFSLGFDEPTEQPVRKNKMASNIFGTPEENQASLAKSAGAKSSGGREDLESSGLQRRNSSEASSGDFLDLKGEGDIHGPVTFALDRRCINYCLCSICTILERLLETGRPSRGTTHLPDGAAGQRRSSLPRRGSGTTHLPDGAAGQRNGYRNDFGVYILRNLRGRRSRKLRQRSLPDCRKCGHRLARQPEAE
ncbi:jupiter microtubule associated homolog 1 isoform X2 [Symphalangus syndactylus]|uniref:jupiter microtubule associated homolog 1 isoform X2 n=1 Tax=Symphalangus syndactylus TaxID=9590 RepID=UPI003007A128